MYELDHIMKGDNERVIIKIRNDLGTWHSSSYDIHSTR